MHFVDAHFFGKFNAHFKRSADDLVNGKLAGLSKPQEAALLKQLSKTGLTFNFRCRDTDKIDDTYRKSCNFKPRPGESLKNFANRAINDAGADFKSFVKNEEGNINIKDLSISANFPAAA